MTASPNPLGSRKIKFADVIRMTALKEKNMENSQKTSEETVVLKKKHGTWWIWLIAIIVMIVAINASTKNEKKPTITGSATGQSAPMEPASTTNEANTYHGKIKILTVKWEKGQFGMRQIVGVAENVSGSELSYAQIEINLLDASGATVGSTLTNINNLAAGAKWKFKAPVMEESAKKFEVKDVTVM